LQSVGKAKNSQSQNKSQKGSAPSVCSCICSAKLGNEAPPTGRPPAHKEGQVEQILMRQARQDGRY
jgi:hypothetical protein